MLTAIELSALTHGWSGLGVACATVQAPLLAGLMRGGAHFRQLLLSPLLALPLTAAVGAAMSVAGPVAHSLGLAVNGLLPLTLGGGLSAWASYTGGLAVARRKASNSIHQRGALIADDESSARSRRSTNAVGNGARAPDARDRTISIGGISIDVQDETKHFKFIGTTGTGKSTAIHEALSLALGRGDRAVIADPDGGYLERFHDSLRGDVILNPFESRSMKWDLFGEITTAYDVEQLARSLIPDHVGSDRSWREYARTFFIAVTRQAHAAGVTDVAQLYRLLVTADRTELRTLVDGTAAQPFLEEDNGRMFDSIRSVTSSAVGALDYIAQQNASPISVREWVARGNIANKGGVLFIPYRAGQIAALRSTISAWMRLAIFEAMNQPEGDQRLWFVVDELDALGQIDGLKDALARLRKFGGRCMLGFQSIAQVSSTYGVGEAQTIVENCGNTLILRCSASEHGGTSHFASRLIGQREVLRTTVSTSRRITDLFASTTRSEHFNVEPLVMDSEIEQLPDLRGYLKIASVPQWRRVTLAPSQRRAQSPPSLLFTQPKFTATTQPRADARTIWSLWRCRAQPKQPHDPEKVAANQGGMGHPSQHL